MSKLHSPSLAQRFDAPTDHLGCFGLMCGYSADAGFLNDAAERFTGQSVAQRAHLGRVALALMLDPGNPFISILDVPGIAHLPIKSLSSENKSFALLHAKIALLGFQHQTEPDQWTLRLIVSTGNWTTQTLEESLDMAWCIEVRSDELKSADTDAQLRCADIRGAHSLLIWLMQRFDCQLVEAKATGFDSESALAKATLETWVDQAIRRAARSQPRFFDNRNKSLLDQLPSKIREVAGDVSRNYLAMGSGFYESVSKHGGELPNPAVPTVLRKIVESLRSNNLLTQQATTDVFVNPLACQAVAASVEVMAQAKFVVRAAAQPATLFRAKPDRALHAKFLFSANKRRESNNYSSAWAYLGSGNLTKSGFTMKANLLGGNLEAGVVFAPTSLRRDQDRDCDPSQVVTNLMPVQWETQYGSNVVPSAGADMPERTEQYVAAPVAWLIWSKLNSANVLVPPSNEISGFDVLNEMGGACIKSHDGFAWVGERPRQVSVRWTLDGRTLFSLIPVLDEFGRIAGTALPTLDLTDAWRQLANFPMPPVDEDLPGDDPSNDASTMSTTTASGPSTASYPIRRMMEFIENIAAKQTCIVEADWAVWCNRLEQTLVQASGSDIVQAFRELGLNPLSPLRAPPFRPEFAELPQTSAGERYEDVLAKVEEAWGVCGLLEIGAVK